MNAIAKKLNASRTNSSSGIKERDTKSITSSPTKSDLNGLKSGTDPSSNFTVKDLVKDSSRNSSMDHTASTVSTTRSSSVVESVSKKVAAKAEQKQKIAEAISVADSSMEPPNKNQPTSKAREEGRRQSASSSTSSVELAKKDFPKEIEVGTADRRKSELSAKTELTDEDSKGSSSAQQQTAEHYVREQYGLSELPTEDKSKPVEEVELRYASALCFAIGRAYSEEQQEWLLGDLSAKGYSQSVLNKVPQLLKKSSDLMDLEVAVESKKLITGDLKEDAVMLVYDMYRCSIINDFPAEQEVAIAMIAEEIGVNKFGQVEEVKKQVQLEEEVKKNRLKLLHPDGRDNIEERYEDVVEEEKSSKEDAASQSTSRRL